MEKLVRQIIDKVSSFRRPKNWVLKVISLFFALFLWYFVVGEDKVDMNVTLPVEIVNLPRDLIISNQFKKQIEITVSGQRSLIRGMTEQHIHRSIDLSKAEPGTIVIQNDPDSISLPRGLNILRVQPPTITLRLDRLINKFLPIKPILVGKVDKDFSLDSVAVDPPTLEISGPMSILDQEENLTTSTIDISGLNKSEARQVSLALKPEISNLIGDPVIAVRLNVTELRKKVELTGIPIEFEYEQGKKTEVIYRLHPPTVSVTAEVPQGMVRQTKTLKTLFKARITPETLLPGKTTHKVNLQGNPQIKILSVKPESVNLEILETKKLKIKK